MRALGFPYLLLAGALLSGAARAQAPVDADQLLDRHLQVVGGRVALARIHSRRSAGWIERHGVRVPFEQTQRAPNAIYVETRFPRPGTLKQGFDGSRGWLLHPLQGLRALEGPALASLAEAGWLHPALRLREAYPERRWLGPRDLEGRPALLLELGSGPEGRRESWWFEASTLLLLRVDRSLDGGPQGELPVTVRYEDYRNVDGLTLPFRVRTKVGTLESVVQLDSIQHNLDAPDALFRPRP